MFFVYVQYVIDPLTESLNVDTMYLFALCCVTSNTIAIHTLIYFVVIVVIAIC